MRIFFLLSNAFFPEHFSGQNRTLLELCQKLTELGHEPIILAGKLRSTGNSKILVDREFGFRIFRATNPLKSISALCSTLRPDIAVVVDGHQEGFIEECQSIDIPVAVWFFQVESYYYRNHLLDNTLLYLASSQFVATRIYGLFGVKAQVVSPYIEQLRYHKPRQGKRVLFVNPVREKGVEIIFQLAQHRPTHAFNIVESWGISIDWRAICFERALRCGNIEWFTATSDMNAIFDQTRLLVLPRFNEEGFCRLATEAQLGGIPVLSSDRGHLPDNVGPGGVVVKIDDDVQVWLKHLDRFVADESYFQQMSERARSHALRDELNGKGIIDHLLTLLTGQIAKYKLSRFTRRQR